MRLNAKFSGGGVSPYVSAARTAASTGLAASAKRLVALMGATCLGVVMLAGAGTANASTLPATVDLLAGQDLKVGEVEVADESGTLEVTFNITDSDWCLEAVHVDVAEDADGIPQNRKGNPKIGQFQVNDETLDCLATYTALLGDTPIDNFVVAAHAVVSTQALCEAEAFVFGTERFTGDLYEIELLSLSETFLSATGPFSPDDQNQPNGAAYDAVNDRLYYTAEGVEGSDPSELFFYDFSTSTVDNPASPPSLTGFVVGASFFNGEYFYIPNGTDDLLAVNFNADGTIASERTVIPGFTSPDDKIYRFGDIAISSDGTLYGSTNASGGSSAEFFEIDFGTGTYTEICDDADVIPDCVHSLQLAFGSDGKLYAHSAGSGDVYQVDPSTGAGTLVGNINTYTDLASGGLCIPDEETAWGDGVAFTDEGGSWATYIEITVE